MPMLRSKCWVFASLLLLLISGCKTQTANESVKAKPPEIPAPAQDPKVEIQVLKDVREAYVPNARADDFEAPGIDAMEAMQALASACMSAMNRDDVSAAVEALQAQAKALDFEILKRELGARGYWVLREAKKRRGRGIYLFTPHPESRRVVLQAPHARFDAHTDEIGGRLFALGQSAALFVNTMGRHTVEPKAGERVGASDVANYERSYFLAATKGVAETVKEARFVQLHGYGLKTEPPLDVVQVVVSDGRKKWSGRLDNLATELSDLLGKGKVARYGKEVNTLGATLNVQGIHIRDQTDDLFIHLEMAMPLRKRLSEDANLLRGLSQVLVDALP